MDSSFLQELFNHHYADHPEFIPYIGKKYLESKPKTLVIGEIFNIKSDMRSVEGKESYCSYIFQNQENMACRNICQTLLNYDQALTADRIAFTFFIHRVENGSASVRVNYSKKELDESTTDLVSLIEIIKPERIIYYGSQTKRTIERRSTFKVRGTCFAEIVQKLPNEPEIIPLRSTKSNDDQYKEKIEEGKSVLQGVFGGFTAGAALGAATASAVTGAAVLPIAGLFSTIGLSLGVIGKTLQKIDELASKGDMDGIKEIISDGMSQKIADSSEAFKNLAQTTQESLSQDPNSMNLKIEFVKNLVREMGPDAKHPQGRVMSVQMVGQRLNENDPPLLTATGKAYDIKSRGVGILLGTIYHALAESNSLDDKNIAEQMKKSFTTRNAIKIFERDQILEDEYWTPQNKPQKN